MEEHFEPVMEDIDENSSGSDASSGSEGGKLLNESNKVKKKISGSKVRCLLCGFNGVRTLRVKN